MCLPTPPSWFSSSKTLKIIFVLGYVTEQTGAWPHGDLTHDPTISIEGNRFLLTGVQPWGAESTPAQSLLLPQDPELPLLPKRLKAKTMPRSSPHPYLSISGTRKHILSGMLTCGFPSHHPLAAALSLRTWGALSQHLCSSSGSHVPCYTGSRCLRGWSPGRHVSLHGTLPPGVGSQPCGV